MNDVDRMMIERACERLMAQYCHFIDHGEAARVAELFAEDGVCTLEATMTGREAIREGFKRRQARVERRSRHVCCNPVVSVLDEGHAEGVVYLTLYRHDGEPARATAPSGIPSIIGEYKDTFVRTADGWRFQTRAISVTFVADSERRASAG